MICNFREKRKALVTGPPSHFLFLMCLIIFTTSTIQKIAIIKSPKANISVPPPISMVGIIIIAIKSIMPITNNNVITLSPSFHYRPCRFREKEKNMATSSLSAISRWFPVSWSSKASIRLSPFLIIPHVFTRKRKGSERPLSNSSIWIKCVRRHCLIHIIQNAFEFDISF